MHTEWHGSTGVAFSSAGSTPLGVAFAVKETDCHACGRVGHYGDHTETNCLLRQILNELKALRRESA